MILLLCMIILVSATVSMLTIQVLDAWSLSRTKRIILSTMITSWLVVGTVVVYLWIGAPLLVSYI